MCLPKPLPPAKRRRARHRSSGTAAPTPPSSGSIRSSRTNIPSLRASRSSPMASIAITIRSSTRPASATTSSNGKNSSDRSERGPMTSQHRAAAASRTDQYRILKEPDLRDYLSGLPDIVGRLGGPPSGWTISEVGDGNLNLVFIVKGTSGGVAVKQALPYVRLVGESWPLPLSRSHYEYQALTHQARLAPGLVPAVLHHDEALALVVMELLEPHIILRKGLVAGIVYPHFVDHITTFMARTLFFNSDLAVPAAQKKDGIAAFCGNHALCKITEDLIFTEPYFKAEQNRWTSPWLDATAASFREDLDLHVAVSRLKLKFMSQPETLIHGDLHTGSIMVTASDTRVIDPEFAFYGPMAFDVGAILANLIMSYLASPG